MYNVLGLVNETFSSICNYSDQFLALFQEKFSSFLALFLTSVSSFQNLHLVTLLIGSNHVLT